jgi:adenylylsulfate kinase
MMEQSMKQVVWHGGHVSAEDRQRLLGQSALTIWLTGLSASGKSTLAFALERHLINAGRACYVLDGDNVRHGLNGNLGFSHEDRTDNIRRVAEVAHLMNDAGLIVITAFISPYRSDRAMAKKIIGAEQL